MKPLTPEMKEVLQKQKLNAQIREKIERANNSHKVFRLKVDHVLLEDFTGKDLKRAKKLIKGRKKAGN